MKRLLNVLFAIQMIALLGALALVISRGMAIPDGASLEGWFLPLLGLGLFPTRQIGTNIHCASILQRLSSGEVKTLNALPEKELITFSIFVYEPTRRFNVNWILLVVAIALACMTLLALTRGFGPPQLGFVMMTISSVAAYLVETKKLELGRQALQYKNALETK